MQLVAYGAQDIYLTGQPQITFFKSVYRRHTNFAVESIQQTINGTAASGSRVSVTVSRNGDLLKNLWVQYQPSLFIGTQVSAPLAADLGHAMLQIMELEIGGQLIDRQYGMWLSVWRDLTEVNPTGQQGIVDVAGAEPLITATTASTRYQRMAYTHNADATNVSTLSAPTYAYVPMRFWFCKNPGLAVPLIALQYHEVKFNIQFAQASTLATTAASVNFSAANIQVYADYVYLDTTERRQFAQNAHEYLIDQLQSQEDAGSGAATSETIRLNFNHPIKELIWVGQGNLIANATATIGAGSATPNGWSLSSNVGGNNPVVMTGGVSNVSSKIVLNGTDRFTARPATYFTRNQVWDCHTGFGSTINTDAIGVYSFALRPEEHQPSGTCNFSRIDTAQLVFNASGNTTGCTNAMYIYAVNYNVLRIMSGMGGLAYSN